MPIRVVVITDRKLLAPDRMAARVAELLANAPPGSVLVQVREKDLDGGPLLALTRSILEVARPAGAPVWVNDRVDVALVAGADGAHLPEAGMSVADARAAAEAVGRHVERAGGASASGVFASGAIASASGAIATEAIASGASASGAIASAASASGPRASAASASGARASGAFATGSAAFAIGCSRHTARDVLAAADAGAALVQLGPIWSVPGKGEPLGLEALRIRLPVPLVAVGGIDGPARARHAALAGADAVAVIRAAWQGAPDVVGKLVEAVEAGVAARK